jgi:hypothetical protein
MKKYLTIITFLLLIACEQPAPQTNETIITNITANITLTTPMLSLTEVLDEFSVLDVDLNTSWKKEHIPNNMILPTAVEPWTKRLKLLEDLTEKDSFANKLVQARLEMLRAQVTYYLGAEIGDKGIVPLKLEGMEFTPGLVACENIKDIEKSIKIYSISYSHYLKFVGHMDSTLQSSEEAKQKIGIDENKIAFYDGPFNQAQKKIAATLKAVEDQCDYLITLEDTN